MKKIFCTFFFSMGLAVMLQAQDNDTLALYRQFFTISKNYQRPPLQAVIIFKKSTNHIIAATDTATSMAEFYLQPSMGYIKFGELEQFVTDSIVLMVSANLQKMILINTTKETASSYKMNIGLAIPDSSYRIFAQKYTIEKEHIGVDEDLIKLKSRQLVKGSNMARETIELKFNSQTNEPLEATTTQRVITQVQDTVLLNKPELAKYVLHIEGKGNYFIKEKTEKYVFKTVQHNAEASLPVHITDRIFRDTQGNFIPAKGYEGYVISRQ